MSQKGPWNKKKNFFVIFVVYSNFCQGVGEGGGGERGVGGGGYHYGGLNG